MTSEFLTESFGLQAEPKSEIQPETAELCDKIVALDAELAEDFKTQFSVAPFLSRKVVSFQETKANPHIVGTNIRKPFQRGLLNIFLGVM